MAAHVAQNCNTHTAGIYRGSLENHILPALGMMPLGLVESAHVAALHYNLRATPRAANRALAVLSKMFTLAAAWGLVADGTNPCRAVRKYREKKRERFLSREEYRRLGPRARRGGGGGGNGRGGRRLPLRHRGAPPPHAHRLPPQRDPHAALGRRGPHRRRVPPPRRQDRCPHGPPHPHRGRRARRHPPRGGQPLDHRRQAARNPPRHHHRRLVPHPRPRRAWRTCASTTSATPMPHARSPPARASP